MGVYRSILLCIYIKERVRSKVEEGGRRKLEKQPPIL